MIDHSERAVIARRKAAAKRSRLRRKERGEERVRIVWCPSCRRPSKGVETCEWCGEPIPAES